MVGGVSLEDMVESNMMVVVVSLACNIMLQVQLCVRVIVVGVNK